MVHKSCGGKLRVIDTMQVPTDTGVKICRLRKCIKCNAVLTSYENVRDSEIAEQYTHNGRIQ